jgi:hypothetical protein
LNFLIITLKSVEAHLVGEAFLVVGGLVVVVEAEIFVVVLDVEDVVVEVAFEEADPSIYNCEKVLEE